MVKISVTQIRQRIGASQSFHFVGSGEAMFDGDGPSWLSGLVEVEGEAVNNGGFIIVRGTIKTGAALVCNRCLVEYVQALSVPFSENFNEGSGPANDGDQDLMYFEGDEIELAEIVRETLLLAEPLKSLCSEDCKGLCAKCGINLNLAECTCDRNIIDPRLAALGKLLPKE